MSIRYTLSAEGVLSNAYYEVHPDNFDNPNFNSTGTVNLSLPGFGVNTVRSIANNAFLNLPQLGTIIIPNSVTFIGTSAFEGCIGLRGVTIQTVASSTNFISISSRMFFGCSVLTSISIPIRVTSIDNSAFQNCSKLPSITIPSSITSIGTSAFQACSLLTNIILQRLVTLGLTTLGSNCLSGTSLTQTSLINMLKGGYIQTNLTTAGIILSVAEAAIAAAGILITVNTSGLLTNYSYVGGPLNLNIPVYVTSIGSSALLNCPLTSVIILTSVTAIDANAFQGCAS